MSDIYSAPQANLSQPVSIGEYGSLERGIAGDYQFSIGEVLSEAWGKTKGSKTNIWLGGLIYFAVLIVISAIFGIAGFMVKAAGPGAVITLEIIKQIATMAIGLPMAMGLFVMGIRRSVGVAITPGLVFRYFPKLPQLLVTAILFYLLVALGFVLLIIPGIYLLFAYNFAQPLVVEKNLRPWQALEASRKAITHRWFAFFGIALLLMLINFATVFTLFIGLLWTVPFSAIAAGILYRNIFGIEPATLEN
jgi:uncharacterized membrane protein